MREQTSPQRGEEIKEGKGMNILTKEFIAVAIGGAIGSISRFGLSRWIQTVLRHKDYPWGIFVCNVLGCLLVGILAGILIHRFEMGPVWRAALLIGVLGGFTTFSSFSIDTITMMQAGQYGAAFSNIILTLVFCLIATAGGLMLTRSFMIS